jgi:hypothetical protein
MPRDTPYLREYAVQWQVIHSALSFAVQWQLQGYIWLKSPQPIGMGCMGNCDFAASVNNLHGRTTFLLQLAAHIQCQLLRVTGYICVGLEYPAM